MEIEEVTNYLIMDDGDYLGSFEDEDEALGKIKELKEVNGMDLPCTGCKFCTEQPGSYHVSCSCKDLSRDDLEFVSKGAVWRFFKLDFDPNFINSCKKRVGD